MLLQLVDHNFDLAPVSSPIHVYGMRQEYGLCLGVIEMRKLRGNNPVILTIWVCK